MPLITDLVASVAPTPTPVVCLDACDLLNLVQCVSERRVDDLGPARRLQAASEEAPPRLLTVVTSLVVTEFHQNIDRLVAEADRFIRDAYDRIDDLGRAAREVGGLPPALTLTPSNLPGLLRTFAERVLNTCPVLDLEDDCVQRALRRVLNKARPSHEGRIKDSIHLEHYLEVARQIRAAGSSGRVIFVSSNSRDFWEAKNRSTVHPDLRVEFASVGLEFFGSWAAVCGTLGI